MVVMRSDEAAELWACAEELIARPDRATLDRIITNCGTLAPQRCASCAARCSGSSRCGRCKTIYCDAKCQATHWRRGGHARACADVATLGLEQHHAEARAINAAAEAAERGSRERCYICLGERGTTVRACACKGSAGAAHVACLVKNAKSRGEPGGWSSCSLCGEGYRGSLRQALAWACWAERYAARECLSYRDRPPDDKFRALALRTLGDAAHAKGHLDLALRLRLGHLAVGRRYFFPGSDVPLDAALSSFPEIAECLSGLGRAAEAIRLDRKTHEMLQKHLGPDDGRTLVQARNLAASLAERGEHPEALRLLRDARTRASKVFGPDHEVTMRAAAALASVLLAKDRLNKKYAGKRVTELLDEAKEAQGLLFDYVPWALETYGEDHPSYTTALEGAEVAKTLVAEAERTPPASEDEGGGNGADGDEVPPAPDATPPPPPPVEDDEESSQAVEDVGMGRIRLHESDDVSDG